MDVCSAGEPGVRLSVKSRKLAAKGLALLMREPGGEVGVDVSGPAQAGYDGWHQ
jgi:hypothetical protein